jgi:hypothetical protein
MYRRRHSSSELIGVATMFSLARQAADLVREIGPWLR